MAKRSPARIGSFEVNEAPYTIDELIERLKYTIADSHVVSNETYGILLSGGVDSSVLALLSKPYDNLKETQIFRSLVVDNRRSDKFLFALPICPDFYFE